MKKISDISIATKAIHGKHLYAFKGPVTFPIYQTSTYRFKDSYDAVRYSKGDPSVYVYSRYHNPTVDEVADRIAYMEGSESALLFSSGMAAITTLVFSLCRSGEEIISTPALYGGTYRFFRDHLIKSNIHVKYVDPFSLEDLLYLITPRTKIVYFETPTNPTLSLVDIKKIVSITRKVEKELKGNIKIIIDNTFATILNQNPFDYGVDIVVESSTKYLGGHADLIGGVVIGEKKIIKIIKEHAKYLGGCTDPFAAYLLDRSLKTFPLRVEKQNENALILAEFLEKQTKIKRVLYPGLKSHPQHQLARKQMKGGYGGMVTIELKGGIRSAVKLCDNLKIAINAMSLGGVETLVSIPVYSSHINMSNEELIKHGVTPGMVRISVGIENIRDLIADFRQALKKI